jgi:tetraacyldisaccharide 4'-kinase
VGNITVGGTGKTPIVDRIISHIGDRDTALVSRGYKRKTRGLVYATSTSTAADIGDEPLMIHNHHKYLTIAIDGNRNAAIKSVIKRKKPRVIIMDDGMQHRSTQAYKYIMVCDYARPIWKDYLLPAGNLRESAKGSKRASIIIINKCPADLSEAERDEITKKMNLNLSQTILFSTMVYGDIIDGCGKAELSHTDRILAIAGIARPAPFFDEVKRRFKTVHTLTFDDHHEYTTDDILDIKEEMKRVDADVIITTEKDFVRLPYIAGVKVCYLPIGIEFLFDGEKIFNKKIDTYVTKRN